MGSKPGYETEAEKPSSMAQLRADVVDAEKELFRIERRTAELTERHIAAVKKLDAEELIKVEALQRVAPRRLALAETALARAKCILLEARVEKDKERIAEQRASAAEKIAPLGGTCQ